MFIEIKHNNVIAHLVDVDLIERVSLRENHRYIEGDNKNKIVLKCGTELYTSMGIKEIHQLIRESVYYG